MRKQFLVVLAGAALLGGCAMGPPPGAYYVAPSATSAQGRIPLAAPTPATPPTPEDVTCWQHSLFGWYLRTEVLLYKPATPPVCTEPLEPYGYAPQPYSYGYPYQPYGYGYVRPFVLFPHLWGDDDR